MNSKLYGLLDRSKMSMGEDNEWEENMFNHLFTQLTPHSTHHALDTVVKGALDQELEDLS